MASKTKDKVEPMVIENPPPPKKRKSTTDQMASDVEYIGNELSDVSERVNELELCIEDMRKSLLRVMERMGL